MERQDKGLAYLLQYEHVAWFENGMVRILDRRIYPSVIRYVECKDYREVVQAIRDMVTQSAIGMYYSYIDLAVFDRDGFAIALEKINEKMKFKIYYHSFLED